jgi:glyoxylase-like metal-dependent hydrolase (beta-lactamase superfamily II)
MIVERSMNDGWLSNSYLVADEAGGTAVLIDSGGPVEPLAAAVERHGVTISHLLITHADHDHIASNDDYRQRYGMPIAASRIEADRMGGADVLLEHDQVLHAGGLEIRALSTPGHSPGHLAFLINGDDCFTGDVLFQGTVGGTLNDSYEKLQPSVMEVLMQLPDGVRVHPGHTDPTSIGAERKHNPFIRIWRGLDAEGDEHCLAMERPATLVLLAPDYDGGHKGWVRWDDTGHDDIVPGSRVQVPDRSVTKGAPE